MKSRILLLTQADDIGGSLAANEAAEACIAHGVLKNLSVMVTEPAAAEDAARRFADRSELCIGLHCTLHSEWDHVRWKPVLPPEAVPSLIREDGTFHSSPLEHREAGVKPEEMMAELQAQLDRMRKLGFHPIYADTHMRFEWIHEQLPALFDDWCASVGLISYRQVQLNLPGLQLDSADPIAELTGRIAGLEPGAYRLLTHPALDSEEIRAYGNDAIPGSQVAYERMMDHRLWCDSGLKRLMHETAITPVRYDELA